MVVVLSFIACLFPDVFFLLGSKGHMSLSEEAHTDVTLSGELQMVVHGTGKDSAVLSHVHLIRDGREEGAISDVRISAKAIPASSGHYVRLKGTLTLFEAPTNPGQFDSRTYYAARGIIYRLDDPIWEAEVQTIKSFPGLMAAVRGRARDIIGRAFPEETAGYAAALLIGDKSQLSGEDRDLWQMSGISHMLAISGMHLSLVGMGLMALFKRCGLSLRSAIFLSVGFLIAYAFLTGFSVSTLRAFIMFAYQSGARFTGRQSDRKNSLSLAVILILLDNPLWLLDVSFRLSFAAALAAVLFENQGPLKMAALMFLIPMPFSLYHFGEVSLTGLGLNLLVVPLLPVVLILCFIGLAGSLLVGNAAALPAYLSLRGMTAVLDFLSRRMPLTYIGGAPTWGRMAAAYGLMACGFFLFHRYRRHKRRLLLPLLIPLLFLVLKRPAGHDLTLTMLDVGQGDCLLMEMPDGTAFMTDCGSSTVSNAASRYVLPFLKHEGIGRLDYLAATHMDDDHINGIEEMLDLIEAHRTSLRIGTLILPYRETMTAEERALIEKAEEIGIRILVVKKGDRLAFGGEGMGRVTISVIGPEAGVSYASENEMSLILAVKHGDFDALLTGDTEGKGEELLTSYLREHPAEWDLLKAAHHGSKYSTGETFLKAMDPSLVFISAGAGNRYGHPHRELLKRLKSGDYPYLVTKYEGAIACRTDGRRACVRSFRNGWQKQKKISAKGCFELY